MADSTRCRAKTSPVGATLQVMINHPMEAGLRRDPKTGEVVPEHYITTLTVKLNGTLVATHEWGGGVARNPYLAMQIVGAKVGDKVEVSWVDNRGQQDSATHAVA